MYRCLIVQLFRVMRSYQRRRIVPLVFYPEENFVQERFVHFLRSCKDPEILAVRLSDNSVAVIRGKVNDPVVAPDEWKKRKKRRREPYFEF